MIRKVYWTTKVGINKGCFYCIQSLAPFHRITNWAFDSRTLMMWVEMRLFFLMCHINKQYLQIENGKHCSLA